MRDIQQYFPEEVSWAKFEVVCYVTFIILGFLLNWKFMLFLIPFNYLGNCLSSLNGFYEHFGGVYLIVQGDAQKRTVDLQPTVVVDEAKLPELVHEEAHS